MKLMALLDCMPNTSITILEDIEGELIWRGLTLDVPEDYWDKEVYFISSKSSDRFTIQIMM